MGTISEESKTLTTQRLKKAKSRSKPKEIQATFDIAHFLQTGRRGIRPQPTTKPTPLPRGARKDKFGQVYVPIGIYYRKIGEKRRMLYRCSAQPHRVKTGTRPNPFRHIRTIYQGLTKKQEKNLADANRRRQTPWPTYKEYRYWNFTQVIPALRRKKPRPIPFEEFLRTLEHRRKGHTDLRTQIVGLVKFLLQTDFRYCGLYVRTEPNGERKKTLFGTPLTEPIPVIEVVRAVCDVYRACFRTPDQSGRFQIVVKGILRTHPGFEIATKAVSLGQGDFEGWASPAALIALVPISTTTEPGEHDTVYSTSTERELGGVITWGQPDFIEATLSGAEHYYQLKIETLQLKPKQADKEKFPKEV